MVFLGLDIGNTRMKAGLFDEKGDALYVAARDHSVLVEQPGRQEIDPNLVLEHFAQLVAECVAVNPDIEAIAVSCMAEAFTPVDAAGQPLANTLLTQDMRGLVQSAALEKQIGTARIKRITGLEANAKFTAPKLMWFRQNAPEIFGKARYFTSWMGMICLVLGVEPHCDYSFAGKTMMFDIDRYCWDDGILESIGVKADRLDRPVPAGTNLGRLSAKTCERFGFGKPPVLVMGSFDQACVNLGCGAVEEGDVALGMGTVFCMINRVERTMGDSLPPAYPIIPDAVPGKYINTASVLTAGQVLTWTRDTFYTGCAEKGDALFDVMLAEAEAARGGPMFFPYLAGSGTPTVEPLARAAFLGLHTGHTRGDMLRAAMEGVALELRLNLDIIESAGIQKHRLIVSGGGSRSLLWVQILCDVLNKPVLVSRAQEAGALGAAILAAWGSGHFAGVLPAATAMVKRPSQALSPKEASVASYAKRFELYRSLYEDIIAHSRRMHEME